ncbi:hypothetical protein VR010_02075 [Actinomycetaceae bacterium L2_0104]
MKLARRVLGTLFLALLLAVGLAPATEAAEPSGGEDSSEWFQASGLSVVRSHAGEDLSHLTAAQLDELQVGTPVRAYTFDGEAGELEPSNLWVAPVLLEDEPVATVAAELESGQSQREKVTAESRFATALTELEPDSVIAVEPDFGGKDSLGGWFQVNEDGTVTPLDPVARSVLAGEVTMNSFQEIRADLLRSDGDSATTADPTQTDGSATGGIIRIVAIVLIVLFVAVGLLVWLRHDHSEPPEEDERKSTPRSRPIPDDVKILERPRSRHEEARE